jgi:hypothetical protein
MVHPDAEDESAAGDRVQRQRPLGQLCRVLYLDRDDTGCDFDGVDIAQRGREQRGEVGVPRHLGHPYPAETLVAQLSEAIAGCLEQRTAVAPGDR